jgi:tRNA (mo5U34)-methyltransferase
MFPSIRPLLRAARRSINRCISPLGVEIVRKAGPVRGEQLLAEADGRMEKVGEFQDWQSTDSADFLLQRASKVADCTKDEFEARKMVASIAHWHHKFEICSGVVTPGTYEPRFLFDKLQLPDDMTGVRALDVGASDGFFSMQMALRGASVTAVDYRPKNLHGFALMESLTGLNFDYHQLNVYSITPDKFGCFDIVLFLGVLYHLPDMIRALDTLRQVCKGQLFLETEHERELQPGVAVARYYEAATLAGDITNFWSPNRECVNAMLRDAGFSPARSESWSPRRSLVNASATGVGRTEKMRLAYGLLPG